MQKNLLKVICKKKKKKRRRIKKKGLCLKTPEFPFKSDSISMLWERTDRVLNPEAAALWVQAGYFRGRVPVDRCALQTVGDAAVWPLLICRPQVSQPPAIYCLLHVVTLALQPSAGPGSARGSDRAFLGQIYGRTTEVAFNNMRISHVNVRLLYVCVCFKGNCSMFLGSQIKCFYCSIWMDFVWSVIPAGLQQPMTQKWMYPLKSINNRSYYQGFTLKNCQPHDEGGRIHPLGSRNVSDRFNVSDMWQTIQCLWGRVPPPARSAVVLSVVVSAFPLG